MRTAVRMRIDIEGHEETMWAYEMGGDDEYDLILGRPWLDQRGVTLSPARKSIFIYSSQTRVRSKEGKRPSQDIQEIGAPAFIALAKRLRRESLDIRIFTALIADIWKAL